MTWYSAHIIMYVDLKHVIQKSYPVWENIVLIRAETVDEAFEKAERYGRSEEGDDDGSFCWGKQPARWVFAGVRKLTECQGFSNRPDDGTEVSYNELELDSREAVEKLAAGKPVQTYRSDRYRPAKRKPGPTEGKAKQGKRSGA
jgi:hypothetical protein